MSPLIAAFHFLGTKPLIVSLIAQMIVLAVAIRTKDNSNLRQSIIVSAALLCVIIGIQLRPPAPLNYWADGISIVGAVLFTIPAIEAVNKLRKQKDEEGQEDEDDKDS